MKKILIIVGAILLVGLVAAGSFWDVMTLSTAMDVTTVNLSASTQVEKSATASVADLQPGMQVTVTGQRDSNGEISASRSMILSDDSSGATGVLPPPDPTAVGMEP